MSGNWGNDFLKEGCGAGVFVFDGDFNQDVVRDFNPNQGDRLEFVFDGDEYSDSDPSTILEMVKQDGKML